MSKVLLGLLCFIWPLSALSAEIPDPLGLDDFLNRVSNHNPRLKAEKARIAVAETERIGAGLLPNPELGYETGQSIFGANIVDGSTHIISLEIPLEIFGQRGLRKALAEEMVEESRRIFDVEHAALLSEARRVFIEAQLLQARLTIYEEMDAQLTEVLHILSERVRLGTMSPYDLLRLELQARQIEAEHQSLKIDLLAMSRELGSLMGTPEWSGVIRPSKQVIQPGALDELLLQHPELNAKQAQLRRLQAELNLTNRERWPVPHLSLGTQLATDELGGAILAGVAFELPIFERKQGEIARIQAEQRVTELEADALQTEILHAVSRAKERVIGLLQLEEAFESSAVARIDDLAERAKRLFEEGVTGVLEIVDALETSVEVRTHHIELMERRLHIELEILEQLQALTKD